MMKGKIEIKDATNGIYVEKTAETSIFSPSWSDEKTLLEISIAFENKIFKSGNTFEGISSNGITIRMFINQTTNEIISAFPIF